jgi:hypothetical protein
MKDTDEKANVIEIEADSRFVSTQSKYSAL